VDHAEQMMKKFNGDFFPYGIEANRKTLEAFCQYAFEQGIAHRHVEPEALFAAGADVDVQI
jgi:4,5-dihydroxyphthalate decarboxylase